MAFTRFNYDDCRTKKRIQESTGSGRYILNTPGSTKENLYFFEDPHIRLQKWGANLPKNASGHPIDIASDLEGRTRKYSKYCKEDKYPFHGIEKTQRLEYKTMKSFTEESRVTHPSYLYRDLEQTRWEYPLLNPQENICIPFQNNLNTRLLEKDYYRPKLPISVDNLL